MNTRKMKICVCTFALLLTLASSIIIIAMPTPANNGTFSDVTAEPQEPIPPSNDTLADASLITDTNTYSPGEQVNISLLSVPPTATVNLMITSPSSFIYIALEEETGLYSFTETTEPGDYTISANLSRVHETKTLTKSFDVIDSLPETEEIEEIPEDIFDLNNATLVVDKPRYAPGETVHIYLSAPPEVIANFNITSPTGIKYLVLPSASGDYEFKPDSAGNYVINVSLRAGDAEMFLTAEFAVSEDLNLEIVFGDPVQGEITIGDPVNWSQHISITNHDTITLSNFSLTIPLPADYSHLSFDAGAPITFNLSPLTYYPPTAPSLSLDIAAGETVCFTITYQTPPVLLEVTENYIDIADLIPIDAFDIEIYEEISVEEPAHSTGIPVKQVEVWHNSSLHYHVIHVAIAVEDGEQIVELAENGAGIEKEIAVEQSEKIASWTIPELSNKTYAVFEVDRDQGYAEINEPVEWQLNVSGTIVTYKTPAPYKTESEPVIKNGKWQKEIVTGSNASAHYSNVTAFSELEETEKYNLRLFWVVNGSRIDVTYVDEFNVSFSDTTNNGILDFVTWTVPLLSNQSFVLEADITVINVQSYPAVGGNWTVRFETTGTANLTITAVNGTTWTNQPYECYDEQTQILTREEISLEELLNYQSGCSTSLNSLGGVEQGSFNMVGSRGGVIFQDFFSTLSSSKLNKLPPCSEIQEGYCQEDGKFYKQGWKFFSDLNRDELVATLNPETKEIEWQLPTDYQTYDHDGEMYKITLEDGTALLVSPEHKVYGKLVNSSGGNQELPKTEGGMCPPAVRDGSSLLVSSEHKIYGAVDNMGYASNPFELRNLSNLLWTFSSSRNLSWKGDVNGDIISTSGQISSVVQSSLNMLVSQRREIINNLFDGDFTFQHLQYLPDHNPSPLESGLSMTDFTVRNNILIDFNSHNNNIDSEYINTFSLTEIREIYQKLNKNQNPSLELFFLDSNKNPVKVKSIKKVPYTGKIYDVDVPNDIVLVRRVQINETTRKPQITQDYTKLFCKQKPLLKIYVSLIKLSLERKFVWDSVKSRGVGLCEICGYPTAIWCGNSNYDLQLLDLKCGNRTLDYQWINNSIFIQNYECNETGYEISKVLTAESHHLKFQFGSDVEYAHNWAGEGVGVVLNKPENNSFTSANWAILNATIYTNTTNNMTVYFYANNNSNGLNASEGLVYAAENVTNETTLTYNLTALPIKPSEDGLVLLMHFDNRSEYGESCTHIYDFSGTGNNGSCSGIACPAYNSTGGRFGGAYHYDGSHDYLTIPDNESLDITTNLSIEAWVNFDSLGSSSDFKGIVTKWDGRGGTSGWGYGLFKATGDGDEDIAFITSQSGGGGYQDARSNVPPTPGVWYHVVGTHNGSLTSNQMRLYINGVLQSNTATQSSINTNNFPVTIGDFEPTNSFYFHGRIDEIAIYNRTLSQEEVLTHYELGDGKYYWKVNASDGVLSNESDVREFTVATQPVITTYTPAKILQIQDERGASYKQSYPYLQKSKTLNASATLSSTDGVGGVRFIVDQGLAGETIVDDTNTSDTFFSAQFSGLSYGNHTLDIIILDESLVTLSGAGQTESIDPFWILPYIIQFAGDSITISCKDDTNGDVFDLADAQSDGNAVTSDNSLELPCWDNDTSPPSGHNNYSNGIHIFYSDYARSIYGTYVFGNNEAQSGITAEGTHDKFQNNNNYADRFTSLDEIGSNANLFGPTHAYVMLGLNDKRTGVTEAEYEANLTKVVNDTHNKGISYENIILLYPTYSPTYDVSNYLDNIDNVASNLGTRLIKDLYNETKDNFNGDKSWYYTDNLHFTRAGSRNISRIIAEQSTWLTTGEATYTGFSGSETTDFNNLPDITNVSDATLQTSTARITWYNNVNAYDANFDTNVDFGFAFVDVNASGLNSTFNSSANLTLYNLPWSEIPAIFEDGSPCHDCQLNFYSGGNLSFNVTHFTNYSAGANANLTIWDDTDPEGGSQTKCINETIKFYANYTNITSGESINGSGVYCNISFNVSGWSAWEEMTFNSSTLLYDYNRSFSSVGTYDWNATCNGSVLGYESLNTSDNVTISSTPTSFNISVRVIQGRDDAEENLGTGAVVLYSSDLELINDNGVDQEVGVRFQDVNIPNSATITSAYLEFEIDQYWDGSTNLTIFCEDEDNPIRFSDVNNNITNRTKTSLSVDWNNVASPAVDEKLQTPDIASIVEVIVNRAGWAANNSMVFIINGTGRREVESYDGANSGGEADTAAPLLVVNYFTGGGSGNSPNVTLNNPSNGSSTSNNWTILNATVTDADNDNTTVYFYANNNGNGLNDSEGLVYIEEKVANGSTVTYNLTALPVKPTEDGLVMLMHFDNRSDYGENYTHVYDFSGNERNGTVIGDPVYNTSGGKFGGGYEFDGSGDYITTPDNSLFNITDNLTVEAWVKFDTTDSGYDGIVAKWCAGCGGDSYGIFKETGSSRYFSFHIYSGGNRQILSDSAFATDTWYHVVGTYNGTTMLMYVNGVQQAQTLSSGSIASTSAAVTIGSFEPESKSWWLDGAIDEAAIYNVTLSPEEVLNHYRLGEGKYYWKVNASDGVLSNESDVWQFTVGVPGEATYSEFNGSGTTDFNNLADITNVSDATLHINNTAKITWYSNVNAYGADFDTNVDFGFAFVDVNATGLNSTFNSSANVTLYNLPWSKTPAIFEDGSPCQDCQLNFYSGGNLSFNVTHFTNYSAGANANLSIWDDTDPEGGSQTKYPGNQIKFYANYTNITSGESINGTGVYCNISFNVTPNGPIDMTFNASSLLYEYNRSFPSSGTFNWNVTCNGSVLGYEDLNVTDTVTASASNNPPAITMNKPDNGSTTPNNRTVLNATVTDADKDNMTVCFYANNNSNGLNDSEGLVYIGENVANGTTLTYNLTALPIKPSESNLSLLMHFDNRSEFGEHTQRNVANAVYDFSGNGNNGTLGNAAAGTAPTWNGTGGEFAGAFEFDGGDDINVGDVMPAGAYTKVAWVKRGDGIFNNNIISGNNNHAFWAPTPSFHLSAGHNGVWNSVEDSVALEVGEWYHVTVTFDPTVNSGQMVLYKNGVQVDSATGVAAQADSSTTYIGRFESGNNWKGTIDEVAIYNRALSSAEIKAHYSLGDGKYYWKVNASDSVLTNESDVWEFTVSTPLVISSYTPAKQLQIEDERGPSYKQSYPYLQKSRTLNASATLSSTDGVGGVRFIVDQGKAGETIVNDTDTSDTLFTAEFSSLCYGNHTLNITILDTNQDPLSGAGQTESIDPFWIVPYIIQFVGDSITISYAEDTTCDVLNLTDVTSGCNAVTSDNFLELPCWDNDAVVAYRNYSNGIHIFYSDYAKSIYGTYVFGNNEAQSGITAAGTHTKFVDNYYGFADRFTSLDENSSNADLFGPTQAYVMLGLNDRHHNVPEATYEVQLTNVVNDIHDKGIPYGNITLLYPTYSPGTWDVVNYLDNIDAVSSNLGTRLIKDLYNETKDNYENSEKSWYFTDNLHFTRAGSRNISRIIAEQSTWLTTGEATYTQFSGSETTDFNNLPDITNVSDATLQTSTARITWYNNVNAYGANFDTNVNFGFAFVNVNSTGLNSTFNSSANVTLYNLLWSETPVIFEDGSLCQDCQLNFYSGGNLSFNVTHFSNYSAGANANLSIWDDTDTEGGGHTKYITDKVCFYANYTNKTSGQSINGTGVYCNISFNVTPNGPFGMTFNSSSLLYEYNRTFSSAGAFNWNVTGNGSVLGYEELNVTDTVTISTSNNPPAITLNKPDNGSSTPNNWAILNATVTDADNDNMTVYFYANNNSNGLNASEGLVYAAENVANETTLTYNLTALPIKPSEDNLSLLMHFDNRSEFGENSTHVYDFSGNGNNGTVIGNPEHNISGGKFAGAFEFDGNGDSVDVLNDPSLKITGVLSIEAWVNFNNLHSGTWRGIVTKWSHTDAGGSGWGYGLFKRDSANDIAFITASSASGGYADAHANAPPTLHTWYHVVGTYDGTTMRLYINGQLQTDNGLQTSIYDNNNPVQIGMFEPSNNFCFNGEIDEVAIYNRTLSAAEILSHYRLGEGEYYWKVNATDGVLSNESDVWQFTVEAPATLTCTCGDICVNETGWWPNNGTFNVSDTPIQLAINNATVGDSIYVYNGSYSENVNVAKRLTIEGEGADVVNITNSTADSHVFNVSANYVNISGFNVTGATGNMKAGIYIGNGVDQCNISDNTISDNYIGIYLNSSSSNNLFANNTISDNTWDLHIKSSASSFTNNTLNGTTVSLTYSGNVSLKGVGSPASDPAGWNNLTKFINATNQSAGAWMFLNFTYSDADVSGLNESRLKVWKYNGTAWVEDGWNGSRYLDAANNVVGVNITSFSVFAPMGSSGNPPVVTLNRPENGSIIPNNWAILNATVTDADNDNMTVYFYANNNNNGLNASEGLVYIGENVANGTTLTYNLTALPIKPSEDNLSLLMHFDNRSAFGEHTQRNVANAVYDFSGNGNNGTLGDATAGTAPTWNVTGGKFAGAFKFDGTDDYVSVNNDPSLRITGPLTLEAWVNFNSLGSSSDFKGIVAKWNAPAQGGTGWGYGLFKTTMVTNRIAFHLASGAQSGNTYVVSNSVPLLHEWYHVVGTYDGTNMLLYIDGTQQTDTDTITGIYNNSEPVTIGMFEPNNNFYLDGTIDEVAIYNRTLSADEILNHYRLGEGKYYWKVNATDGVLSNESDVWQFTVFSETLEIRNQTSVSVISSINFSGATGATVTEPYNNVDGSPQNIASKTPVVTIYNPSSSADYKIWLKVQNESGWTDIINNEKFNVTADDTSPGAVSSWATLIPWGSYKDTGVTVSAGTHKDLYLAYELKGPGSGTSKLSILGEKY